MSKWRITDYGIQTTDNGVDTLNIDISPTAQYDNKMSVSHRHTERSEVSIQNTDNGLRKTEDADD